MIACNSEIIIKDFFMQFKLQLNDMLMFVLNSKALLEYFIHFTFCGVIFIYK